MKLFSKVLLLNTLLLVFAGGSIHAISNFTVHQVFNSVHNEPQPEFFVASPSCDFSFGLKPTTVLSIEVNTHGDNLKQTPFKTKKEVEDFKVENKTIVYLTSLYQDHNIWLSGFYFLISPFHDFW